MKYVSVLVLEKPEEMDALGPVTAEARAVRVEQHLAELDRLVVLSCASQSMYIPTSTESHNAPIPRRADARGAPSASACGQTGPRACGVGHEQRSSSQAKKCALSETSCNLPSVLELLRRYELEERLEHGRERVRTRPALSGPGLPRDVVLRDFSLSILVNVDSHLRKSERRTIMSRKA